MYEVTTCLKTWKCQGILRMSGKSHGKCVYLVMGKEGVPRAGYPGNVRECHCVWRVVAVYVHNSITRQFVSVILGSVCNTVPVTTNDNWWSCNFRCCCWALLITSIISPLLMLPLLLILLLPFYGHYSGQPVLASPPKWELEDFVRVRFLLPVWPCWRQIAHSD